MKRIFILICCLIVAYVSRSQTPELTIKNYKTEKLTTSPPLIDGKLDEALWQNASKAGDFVQFQPREGVDPSFQTEFSILYDENNLYVGMWAYDSSPDSISRRLTRRDNIDGDVIGVDFDSYHDHRTSFGFWVSSTGVKMDRIMSGDGGTEDDSWDPNWFVKTNIDDKGWTAEMKIPLSQLRFEKDSDEGWGLEVMRLVYRHEEISVWQRIPRSSSGLVNNFGNMTGLNGIQPKKQFDITPYTVASMERFEQEEGNPFATGRDSRYTAGLDAKIGLTNNITLDLTVNPDFGQVESDPSQVNLTAYETFFDEKRPFFIEGRSILTLPLMIGDGDLANENLFYTRRIGRRPHGYPDLKDGEYSDMPQFTRILGAAKMTGKTENGWSVGLLESVTANEKADIDYNGDRRSETIEPLSNYFVSSLGKDFNEGNTLVSGMVTAVNRSLDNVDMDYLHKSAYTGGLNFTQFFKSKTYMLSLKTYVSQVNGSTEAISRTQQSSSHYFQRPDATHLELDTTLTSLSGNGGSVMFGKVGNSPWNFGGFLNWKSPGVELNDVGFIRNTDQILPIIFASYQFFDPFSIFRSLRFNSSFWSAFDFAGKNYGLGANINSNAQFTNFWSANINFNMETPSLSNGTLRGGPAFMSPGAFRPSVNISSDERKKFIVGVSAFAPVSFEGDSQTVGTNVEFTYRPLNMLSIAIIPNVMLNKSNLQYMEETSYHGDPRYIMGSIDQKIFGVSARLNLTITPDFTIQYWGQPFIATGSYSNVKMITDPLADNYTDRYHEYTTDQLTNNTEDGYFEIDENMDGVPDYNIGHQDFNLKEFKSNLVARWEYKPGSVFYLVWSQGRSGYHGYGDMNLNRDYKELFQVFPHNVFLMKFSYRFGL